MLHVYIGMVTTLNNPLRTGLSTIKRDSILITGMVNLQTVKSIGVLNRQSSVKWILIYTLISSTYFCPIDGMLSLPPINLNGDIWTIFKWRNKELQCWLEEPNAILLHLFYVSIFWAKMLPKKITTNFYIQTCCNGQNSHQMLAVCE